MSAFVDEAALCVRGGDGGAGVGLVPAGGPRPPGRPRRRQRRQGRRRVAGRRPPGAPRSSPSATTPTASPPAAPTARAGPATAPAAPTCGCSVPGGHGRVRATGEVVADLVNSGDSWLAARGGRGGRGNASFLSNRRRAPSFAEQGEAGEERWLQARAQADGRRGPGRVPQRGQVHPDLPGVGGQAQDRRLPVHHPRAPPGRRPQRRLRVRDGRHPRAHRGGQRGQGPRPPVPAPHRAGPGPGGAARPGPGRRACRRRSRSGSCSTSWAATGPSCSSGPGWSSAPRPTWPLLDWDGDRVSAVTGAGIPELVGRLAVLVDEARAAEPDAGGLRGPPARAGGHPGRARRRRGARGAGPGRGAGGGGQRPHQPPGPRLRARPAEAARRRQGPGPGRRPGGRHRAHRRDDLRVLRRHAVRSTSEGRRRA